MKSLYSTLILLFHYFSLVQFQTPHEQIQFHELKHVFKFSDSIPQGKTHEYGYFTLRIPVRQETDRNNFSKPSGVFKDNDISMNSQPDYFKNLESQFKPSSVLRTRQTISSNISADQIPYIVLCDLWFGQKPDVFNRVQTNHESYAWKHNYAVAHAYSDFNQIETNRHPGHLKLPYFLKLFELGFEWILFLDMDAIVMDSNISVDTLLRMKQPSKTKDIYFCGDTNVINTGFLLMRNTLWTKRTLDEIHKIGWIRTHHENNGLRIRSMHTENEAFSIFLAGCTSNSSYEQMKKCYQFSDQVRFDPKHDRYIESLPPTKIQRYQWKTDPIFLFHPAGRNYKDKQFMLGIALDTTLPHPSPMYTSHQRSRNHLLHSLGIIN